MPVLRPYRTRGELSTWIHVETVPEIVRKTASLVFVRGTLTCGGRPLAAVTGIWKVLRDKPGDKS